MKKFAYVLLALSLLTSCAHQHKCACGAEKTAACTGCKTEAGATAESCGCKK